MEDGIEPVNGHSALPRAKELDLEPELGSALRRAQLQLAIELHRKRRTSLGVEVNRREHAAKRGAPRAPQFGHERPGERIAHITRRTRRFPYPLGRARIDPRRTSQGVRNGGARQAQRQGQRTDGGSDCGGGHLGLSDFSTAAIRRKCFVVTPAAFSSLLLRAKICRIRRRHPGTFPTTLNLIAAAAQKRLGRRARRSFADASQFRGFPPPDLMSDRKSSASFLTGNSASLPS